MRIGEHIGEMRVEMGDPRAITILECRPPWREDYGPKWTRQEIARLPYTKSTGLLLRRRLLADAGIVLSDVIPEVAGAVADVVDAAVVAWSARRIASGTARTLPILRRWPADVGWPSGAEPRRGGYPAEVKRPFDFRARRGDDRTCAIIAWVR